jgi:hypothetical protein
MTNDQYLRKTRTSYSRFKAQCKFRGELLNLTLSEYRNLWNKEEFEQRGRSLTSLVMTRIDEKDLWMNGNIQIIPRHQLCIITGARTVEKNRSK